MRRAGSLWHKRHHSNSSEKSSTLRWTTLVLGGDFEGEVLTLGVVDVAEETEEGDVLQHEEEDPVAPEEAGPVEDDVQAKVGDQSHQL